MSLSYIISYLNFVILLLALFLSFWTTLFIKNLRRGRFSMGPKKLMLGSCLVLVLFFLAVVSNFLPFTEAAVSDIIEGNVRVQILSPTLVRLEVKGPKGFENRPTYFISNRSWPGADYTIVTSGGYKFIQTANFIVKVPLGANTLEGITITNLDGVQIWEYTSLPTERAWLPDITDKPMAWAIADNPRIVPAEWGYNPADNPGVLDNGWDLSNNAPDMYVFLPNGDVRQLRKDFLDLTGHTELVPLHALGYWDSRYYAYTEETALQQIDDYRSRDIPLDNLVIDTDWRVNGSTGYDINTDYFPDMKRFLDRAHAKNVRIMFNDHPEPVQGPYGALGALDREEVIFRNNGLRSLLEKGVDIWWYDRNWTVALTVPSNLIRETWGMYVYDWITADYYKAEDRRPLIMANVDGIDNGYRNNAPSIAAHRYAIQWTGDIESDFASLQREIENAVYSGVHAAYPYISADLGGHRGDPTFEGYVRWLQYGALSPITRPHGTLNKLRAPWTFGPVAEKITRDFVKMRYRLLPLFYSLARENYDNGDPILRRCDFYYPEYPEAKSNTQYLLGKDVLVAPVIDGSDNYKAVPEDWFTTPDGQPGLKGEYFANVNLLGRPVLTRTDRTVNFDWGNGSPGSGIPADNFSVRWTGNITVKEDAIFAVTVDDGIRIYIDNQLVIDSWTGHNFETLRTGVSFQKGTTHSIRIEYYEGTGGAACLFKWGPAPTEGNRSRTLWIPPGNWIDVWNGNIITGPKTVTVDVPLSKMPIYVKTGSIIPLAPDMSYTGEKPWNPITLDVYPSRNSVASARLYEDDTISNKYKYGDYRTTQISAAVDDANHKVTVNIDSAQGDFDGALKNRSWKVRVHKTAEWTNPIPTSVMVDGIPVEFSVINQDQNVMPFKNEGASPDGDIVEIIVPSAAVSEQRVIEIRYAVGENETDKTLLDQKIKEAEQIIASESEKYTSTTLSVLLDKLNRAKVVYSKSDVSQIEVDEALNELNWAISNLELKVISVQSFEATPFTGNVNLSVEGSVGWAHYGLSSATSFNQKEGSNRFTALEVTGPEGLRMLSDSQIVVSWNDGVPTKEASNITNASWLRGIGNSISFKAKISGTEAQRLRVYTTTWKAKGKLEVLSLNEDGSTTPLVTESGKPAAGYVDSPYGNSYYVWTVDFKPSGHGEKTVVVRFTNDAVYDEYGNVSVEAATLDTIGMTILDISFENKTISIDNRDSVKECNLIIAAYESKKLVNLEIQRVTLQKGINVIPYNKNFSGTIKVFLWSSTEMIMPFAKHYKS